LRTSWVYGLHGRNFLLTMMRLLQERDTVSVVSDEIGAPTWARSIAAATGELVRRWRAGEGELTGLFHMTARGETSWYGFACAIAEHLHQQGRLQATVTPILSRDYPTAAQRPLNSRLDCSLLQSRWGIALPDWQVALQQCMTQPRNSEASQPAPQPQIV
ncbi:MAG TPA: dTDP-4-dehydrorhamnose reductase, partial [Pseudomonas sp.]|nr:dTDP-4-dehydrorhamnose reductase [Pseudomonas sp.]